MLRIKALWSQTVVKNNPENINPEIFFRKNIFSFGILKKDNLSVKQR